ncbi:unnamed protein product [Rhodiola kirilowii]
MMFWGFMELENIWLKASLKIDLHGSVSSVVKASGMPP